MRKQAQSCLELADMATLDYRDDKREISLKLEKDVEEERIVRLRGIPYFCSLSGYGPAVKA